eukprot:GFUD01072833.1.p1 GENE.GFUD01072833.1~~GFUD01072833.1.p1  ORF type:complete len:119 (-),score=32.42 GFUD01072833.1:331-666(-)
MSPSSILLNITLLLAPITHTMPAPHNATPDTARAKRAIFDIIPDRSAWAGGVPGVPGSVCQCEQSGSVCVISVDRKCQVENSLQAHKQKQHRRSKLRKMFKKWLQKKRNKN